MRRALAAEGRTAATSQCSRGPIQSAVPAAPPASLVHRSSGGLDVAEGPPLPPPPAQAPPAVTPSQTIGTDAPGAPTDTVGHSVEEAAPDNTASASFPRDRPAIVW